MHYENCFVFVKQETIEKMDRLRRLKTVIYNTTATIMQIDNYGGFNNRYFCFFCLSHDYDI